MGTLDTCIGEENPANEDGLLDTCEIYVHAAITGLKMGTFFGGSGTWESRDYDTLGSASLGFQSFTGLSIEVSDGDHLGAYTSTGDYDADNRWGKGVYYIDGDQFGAGEVSGYTQKGSSWRIALYGSGETIEAGISNSPSSYDFGSITVSQTSNTDIDYFTVTNTGTGQVDVTISGTDLVESGAGVSLEDTESFESSFGDWPNASGNDEDWQRHSGPTGSSGTDPSAAYDGSYYIYVETSSGGANDDGDISIIEYDLVSTKSGYVDFYYHQYGSDQGDLYLEGYDSSWHEIWSSSGNQGNQWNHVTTTETNFSGYSELRFRNVAAGGYRGDVALDLILVYTGEEAYTWTLSDTATQGEDIYGLKAGLDDEDDNFDIVVKKNTIYNNLISGLEVSSTQDWGLQMLAPNTITDYAKGEMSGTVTLTASLS
jgi:hypothetical protein